MGALFLSGWHFATLGSAMMAVSVTEATLFPVIVALACLCHICARDVSFRAGLTLAIAITIVAFPAGAVLGCGWNAIAGAFPDTSGMGTHIMDMIVLR